VSEPNLKPGPSSPDDYSAATPSGPATEHLRRMIRAEQERAVADVEMQLQGSMLHIEVGDKLISREAAWACTQAIRTAWKLGLLYDGQERDDRDGMWWANRRASCAGCDSARSRRH
jgi:hypothetical protein